MNGMYPQVTRIFMIPTATTPVGLEWARGRMDSFVRLTDHVAEITRAVSDSGAIQFRIEAASLRISLLRQSRATERGSSRRAEPPYNADERRFFDLIDAVTEKALESLRAGHASSAAKDGWALMTGGCSVFMNETGLPQFLGLAAKGILEKSLERSGKALREPMTIETYGGDLLGIGVVTALRVYLGQEKLGPERMDLFPHRLHRVDWTEWTTDGPKESHVLLVGSFGIDPR